MIGIRTPIKKASVNPQSKSPLKTREEAGPSSPQLSVRKSVGEWEAGMSETRKTISPVKKTANEPIPKVDLTSATRRASTESVSPPVSKPNARNTRITEAKACLMRAKLYLTNSKTIKKETKEDIKTQVERLFQLVKDAEVESGRALPTRAMLKAKDLGKGKEESEHYEEPDSTPPEQETSKLMAKIEEHSKLLLESNKQMEELKIAIEAQRERVENMETPTYAGVVAAGNSSELKKRTLHSVVVTSSNEEDTGEEVFDRVRKALDAKEGWVKVEKVRKAKNRKVIMGFETTEERDKVKERLRKDGTGLAVEEVKNKNPMLILRDVLLVNTDEDVLKAFKNQNQDIFHGLDGETIKVEIKYRKRARNPHTGHIVLSTSPTIWQRVTAKGHVHIDLQRIRAEDQTPLMQCTRCLGYGHSKRFCEEAADMCSHCGGPHLRSECEDWMAGVPAACRNCKKANSPQVDHNAFSAGCPQRRKWDQLARATVAYC